MEAGRAGISGMDAAEMLGFSSACDEAETVRLVPPDRLVASVPRSSVAALPAPSDGSIPSWAGAIAIHWLALCPGIKSATVIAGDKAFDVARDEELCRRLEEVESAYWKRIQDGGNP